MLFCGMAVCKDLGGWYEVRMFCLTRGLIGLHAHVLFVLWGSYGDKDLRLKAFLLNNQ